MASHSINRSDGESIRSLEYLQAANLAATLKNVASTEALRSDTNRLRSDFEKEKRASEDRSFSHWRQTPDGKYYLAWLSESGPRIEKILAMENAWRTETRQYAKDQIPKEERTKVQEKKWIPTPMESEISRGIRLGAVVAAVGGALLAILAGLLTLESVAVFIGAVAVTAVWALVIVVVVSFALQLFGPWAGRNEEAGVLAAKLRVERFGFDPLDKQSSPGSIVSPEVYRAAIRATEIVANAKRHHPCPEELPDVPQLSLVPRDSLSKAYQQEIYDRLKREM